MSEITSRQISGLTLGSPNGTVSLVSTPSRWVSERPSGSVAYSDFNGKVWRQGVGSPLPIGVDERYEGYYSSGSVIETEAGAYNIVHKMSEFPNGEYKGSLQCNSYFYSEPRELYLSGKFEANVIDKFSGRDHYAFVYIWGYRSGYLSGSRVSMFSSQRTFGVKNYDRSPFTVQAGYPYVVLNFGTFSDGKNTNVSGQETSTRGTFENFKVET
jgi:hypothetical protein